MGNGSVSNPTAIHIFVGVGKVGNASKRTQQPSIYLWVMVLYRTQQPIAGNQSFLFIRFELNKEIWTYIKIEEYWPGAILHIQMIEQT